MVVNFRNHPWLGSLTAVASMGYAFPGTVLAIGVVTFAGVVDGGWNWLVEDQLGLTIEHALIGSIGLLIFGYVARFQAIGYGATNTGIKRLSPNIMNASFMLDMDSPARWCVLRLPYFTSHCWPGGCWCLWMS